MKYLKTFENWNPSLNKKVKEFVDDNKHNLSHLWDDGLSEEENTDNMIKHFTEYPDEMKSILNGDNVTLPTSKTGLKNSIPVLQNIGGVHDFKSSI